MEIDFSSQIFEKYKYISNFIKIFLIGTQSFHADGQTDRHDEANSHLWQFYESAWKISRLMA
jgi:hypothetical protein